MGDYTHAAVLGFKSFVQSIRDWRKNPCTAVVGRRLWGPWPLLSLVVLTLAALAISPFFPSFERVAGFVPPAAVLTLIPGSIRDLFWSVPALFGFVVAWRVRRYRQNDEEHLAGLLEAGQPKTLLFDAGATPIAIAAFVLAAGLELVEPVVRIVQGLDAGWYGVGSHLQSATASVVVVAISAGVLSVNRAVGKGMGQMMGAGFMLFGIRLGIGFSVPWMVSWWAYLPIPHISQLADRSPTLVYTLFNLAVAAAAWVKLREHTEDRRFWGLEHGDDDREAVPPRPELPPLPTSDPD